jgi:hypothetical protein
MRREKLQIGRKSRMASVPEKGCAPAKPGPSSVKLTQQKRERILKTKRKVR